MLLTRGRLSRLCARDASVPPDDQADHHDARAPGWAVVSAGLLFVLLTAGWLVADSLQRPWYSPVRQTVSVMAGRAGTDAWVMTTALLVAGGCYLVTAGGLTCLRPPARALLVLAGLCSVGIALSPDSPGGPGASHIACTVVGAVTITIWPAVAGWRAPAPLARACVLATIVLAGMLAWTVVETQGGDALGLAERLTTTAAVSWPFVIALLWYRTAAGLPAADPEGSQARRQEERNAA
jgi:hypothetical membrane protein